MFTNRKLVLHSLLIQLFLAGAFACMCNPVHLQKSYCQSDLVLVGRYISNSPSQSEDKDDFLFEIKKIHRTINPESTLMIGDQVNISVSRLCSLGNPKPRDKFLIFAMNKTGMLETDICDGTQRFKSLHLQTRIALHRYYNKGCDCISMIGQYSHKLKCYFKYSFVKKKHGICKWMISNSLEICEMGREVSDYL